MKFGVIFAGNKFLLIEICCKYFCNVFIAYSSLLC